VGRININRAVNPPPAVGGGGGGISVQQPDWSQLGTGLANIGTGLADIINPNWRLEKLKKEAQTLSDIQEGKAKRLIAEEARLREQTYGNLADIRMEKIDKARTAAKAEAVAENIKNSIIGFEQVAFINSNLQLESQYGDRMMAARKLAGEATEQRTSRINARAALTHDAAAGAVGKAQGVIQRVIDKDYEAVPWLRTYRDSLGLGSSTATETLAPETHSGTRPYLTPEGKLTNPEATAYWYPESAAAKAAGGKGIVSMNALNELLSRYEDVPGAGVPTGSDLAQMRYEAAREYLPEGASGVLDGALRAAMGVITGEEERKQALSTLSGEEAQLVRTALRTAGLKLLATSRQGDDLSKLVPFIQGDDPDEAAALIRTLQTSVAQLNGTPSKEDNAIFYAMSEDILKAAAHFDWPSQLDMDMFIPDYMARVETAYADRWGRAAHAEVHKRALAVSLAKTTASMVAVGADPAQILDHVSEYLPGVKPEFVKALTDTMKATTAAVYGVGSSGPSIEAVTDGNVGGYLDKVSQMIEVMLPTAMKNPATKEAYFAEEKKQAAAMEHYRTEARQLVDMYKTGRITSEDVMAVVEPGTGRLYDFNVGDDGKFSIRMGGDDGQTPVYLEEEIGPYAYGIVKGAEMFAPKPQEAFNNAVDRAITGLEHPEAGAALKPPAAAPSAGTRIEAEAPEYLGDAFQQYKSSAAETQKRIDEATQELETMAPINVKQAGEGAAQEAGQQLSAVERYHETTWRDWKSVGDTSYGPSDQLGAGNLRYRREQYQAQLQRMRGADSQGASMAPPPVATAQPQPQQQPQPGRQTMGRAPQGAQPAMQPGRLVAAVPPQQQPVRPAPQV